MIEVMWGEDNALTCSFHFLKTMWVVMRKTTKPEVTISRGDFWKWVLVFRLIAVGIVGNAYFVAVPVAIRAAVAIVMLVLVLGLSAWTRTGHKAVVFFKAARVELRKVSWPSRPETMQATLVVVAMVVITALVMWGVDAFFLWGVNELIGQRG